MTLTADLINQACDRFVRETDRYTKMTRTVEDLCLKYFLEDSALQANITARTKSLYSFRKKLTKLMRGKDKDEWKTCEDVFQGLSDFSGVRISLYSDRDLEAVHVGLGKLFDFTSDDVDVKDKFLGADPASCRFYKATHYQVRLKPSLITNSGKLSNLADLSCEIQVCTMMNHVWNEIEHDIGYKPRGTMSLEEKQLLRRLGILTREGDEIINALITAHRKRSAKEDTLDDPTAFPDVIAELFGLRRVTFRENIGSLASVLAVLKINKISRLQGIFAEIIAKKGVKDFTALWLLAQREIKRFNTFLRKNGYEQYQLEPNNSADPALFLLYEELSDKILQKLPAGRGKGRPQKIRSIASRYEEYLKYNAAKNQRRN